jgi:hypothetical protein
MRKRKTILQLVIFKIARSHFLPFFILFVTFISVTVCSLQKSTCHFRRNKLSKIVANKVYKLTLQGVLWPYLTASKFRLQDANVLQAKRNESLNIRSYLAAWFQRMENLLRYYWLIQNLCPAITLCFYIRLDDRGIRLQVSVQSKYIRFLQVIYTVFNTKELAIHRLSGALSLMTKRWRH